MVQGTDYYYSHHVSEPFSELGILGPHMKIADYPSSVVAGRNFTLYLYVGNHEGHLEYYNVLVKLGDRNSTINENVSLDSTPIYTFSMMLVNNQTYLQPITLSIPHPGTNIRLVFELWAFNASTDTFTYTGIYNQLWLNVTSASR